MDIWLIRDGEKTGPLHDYEVRRKIEDGELPATTPAWHEGLGAWRPLVEIDLFTREFERVLLAPEAVEPVSTPPEPATPPPLPRETFYIRRFWARWFDLTLYAGLWWISMWAARQDIEAALTNWWILVLHYVPWFLVEILLISHFATTPGKWLLGLRVTNKDGSLLDLTAATRRSLRVMFIGIGFGWGPLAVFCQALSIFTAKRLGTTLWDFTGGHQVTAELLNPLKLVALVLLFAGSLLLQLIVISPYTYKLNVELWPALKQQHTENPFWHLPKRS